MSAMLPIHECPVLLTITLSHILDVCSIGTCYHPIMARTNQDGKEIRLVLSWLTGRNLVDADMAAALTMAPATYSRRKDSDDFPTFEELETFGQHFHLSARSLQVAFGHLGKEGLAILDEDGMRQYVEQGGGEIPDVPTVRGMTTTIKPTTTGKIKKKSMVVDPSAPPL